MTAAVLTHYDIDDVLADTFPASDPPSWTPGMARPTPEPVNETLAAGVANDATRSRIRRERTLGFLRARWPSRVVPVPTSASVLP